MKEQFINRIKLHPKAQIDRAKFPFTIPSLANFESLEIHPNVTFFIGDNGSGKSTLLEAIAVCYGFPPEGGTKDHVYRTFDSHSNLNEQLVVAKGAFPKDQFFFRSESFYNLATYFENELRPQGRVPRFGWAHERSHGEGFLDAARTLKANGLYLFDEPEAALSLPGQLQFLKIIRDLTQQGSQFIIATHSPILLGLGGNNWIYRFNADGIERCEYHDTDNYRLTLAFLRNRESFARELGLEEIQLGLDM